MKYLVLLNKLFILPLLPLALIPIISLLKCIGAGFLCLNVNKRTCMLVKFLKLQRGAVSSGTLILIFLSLSLSRSGCHHNYTIGPSCHGTEICCPSETVPAWGRNYYTRYHYSYLILSYSIHTCNS